MSQLTDKQKNWLKFSIKVLITSAALFFVFRKIDLNDLKEAFAQANWFYIILGILAFNISKIISAFRVNELYKITGLRLSVSYNLKLYYLGMFYNLFLPGSIGGDGYKVYLLSQNSEASTRSLISASILDRLSGMSFLFILGAAFLLYSTFQPPVNYYQPLVIIAALAVLPGFYLFVKLFFKKFLGTFFNISVLSLFVQLGQALSAYFIILALGVNENPMDYLALFMLSSAVSVIPFTIGGVGARELVFIYGQAYMNINEPASIALTLLFFASMAITALIGLLFVYKIDTVKHSSD